jgi:hypothetical protein
VNNVVYVKERVGFSAAIVTVKLKMNHKIKTNICTVFSYTELIAPTYVSASRSHYQGVPSKVMRI